jgi:hypothetical protein
MSIAPDAVIGRAGSTLTEPPGGMGTDLLRQSPLGLDIDDVLAGESGGSCLLVGHSPDGQRWLAALVADDLGGCRWLCAPHSELAISCVRTGRAVPADLFRHSATGMVYVISLAADGAISESVRLGSDLSDGKLCFPPQPAA